MPLHPEYFEFLQQVRELELPPSRKIGVAGIRSLFRKLKPEQLNLAVGSVLNLIIRNEDSREPIRISVQSGTGRVPLVIACYSGGREIELDTNSLLGNQRPEN